MREAITYEIRRGEIETYFDRTAAETWKTLTSTAPVGRIRASVRAGRDRMRTTLLSFLPQDMSGLRILDAGCGTGALAIAAAARGADVVAVDLSATLIAHAKDLADRAGQAKRIRFLSGDMLDVSLGRFDHVVLMDSLIHYELPDAVATLGRLAPRTERSVLFTFAPSTPLLAAMHRVGRLFPRSERAPAIVPVKQTRLHSEIARTLPLQNWRVGQDASIESGFYKSHAVELVRS